MPIPRKSPKIRQKPKKVKIRQVNGMPLPESPFLKYGANPGEFVVKFYVVDGRARPRLAVIQFSLRLVDRLTCPEEILVKSAKFRDNSKVPRKFFLAMRSEAAKVFVGGRPGRIYLP